MLRLRTGAVLLVLSLRAAPAAHATLPTSDPVSEATARAVEFWGGTPCGGAVTVIPGPLEEAPVAGENDAEATSRLRAAMWSTWLTPAGTNQFVSPTTFGDCVVHVNPAVWPTWQADDREFAAFCKEMIHEYGHFEGFPDVGAAPDTIQYEQPVLAHVPLCESYRLVYGPVLYAAGRPRGQLLRTPHHRVRRRHR